MNKENYDADSQQNETQTLYNDQVQDQNQEQEFSQSQYQYQNQYQNQNPYQNQNQPQKPYIPFGAKKKHSILAIIGFIFSLTGCLSFIGLLISIIDLIVGKKEEKHIFAIVGTIISSIWLIISILAMCASIFYTRNHATVTSPSSYYDSLWDDSNDTYGMGDTEDTDTYDFDDDNTYDDDDNAYDDDDNAYDDDDYIQLKSDLYVQAQEDQAIYGLNTAFENSDLEVTMHSFGDYTQSTQTPSDSNYKYYYISVTYDNYADYATYIDAYDFECFADGTFCDHAIDFPENDFGGSLDSNYTYDATIVFKVPINAQKVDFLYSYTDDDDDDSAVIFSGSPN